MSAFYAIRPGDTLGAIASKHGTTVDEIMELNPHIVDPNLIMVGQLLNLTGDTDDLGEEQDDPAPPGAPDWYKIALAEEGISERLGSLHNPRIIEYHQTTTLRATEDEVPWCSSFVNWCFTKAGIEGTDSAAARSWLKWGREEATPNVGSVAVFSRPPNPNHGHVAFYSHETPTHIFVLGGNQSNKVQITGYARSRLLEYRMPAGH